MKTSIFASVKGILDALEVISDVVHKVPAESPARKEIDDQVSRIAQYCIDISAKLADEEAE